MSCTDHHLGMNYVQVSPGVEPSMLPWCFTCKSQPKRAATSEDVKPEPVAKAPVKRTPRSK